MEACLAPAGVLESADSPLHSWLSHEAPDTVKARFEKLAADSKKHWNADTFVISCKVGGQPAHDTPAVTVKGSNRRDTTIVGNKAYFSDLATRAGRTQQEADVLFNKYAQIQGTFFRQVPNGKGGYRDELTVILNRHEKKLGIAPPVPLTGASGAERGKMIEEAKKRGDRIELMRIAAESMQGAEPTISQRTDQQTWSLLESAYPDLAEAAYQTRITQLPCPCLKCEWPK